MNLNQLGVALYTIIYKEIRRFMRIWPQTLLPPAITMTLYFVIFGNLVGSRIGEMGGFSYMQFIVPGLIMMAVITNSYANVSSSFFSSKFQKSIEELIMSPVPLHAILWGYVLGGVARGILVAIIVTSMSLFLLTYILLTGSSLYIQYSLLRYCFHWVALLMRYMPNPLMTSRLSPLLC